MVYLKLIIVFILERRNSFLFFLFRRGYYSYRKNLLTPTIHYVIIKTIKEVMNMIDEQRIIAEITNDYDVMIELTLKGYINLGFELCSC